MKPITLLILTILTCSANGQSPPVDSAFNIFNRLPGPYTISSFGGYECADFTFQMRNCKIAKPKQVAPSKPWIWRARFWGHEPQTDIALLEKGFHVVYCDVAELLGNQQSNTLWDGFYQFLTGCGLSEKAVMEGMSRGGVYVFNWAAANPQKVACVYVDNPLLNMRHWAQSTLKKDPGNVMLKAFLDDYSIRDSLQLDQFRGSPVDKIAAIVKGNYPILILCADEDEAVSPAENTLLFEQRVRELKGDITVMHKPGFKHHPHSFPDPKPIVDFILKATRR